MRVYEDPIALDGAFGMLCAAARTGVRCPTNGEVPGNSAIVMALAKAGRIKVRIYARNFRVVEILVGPDAGCATAPPPDGGPAYKVFGGTPAEIAAQDAQRRRERVERAEAKNLRRAESRERWSTQPSTVRPCMCCGRGFASEGRHHRMCNTCRRAGSEVA